MNGKITQWHDDKGYGFIQADGSNKKSFVIFRILPQNNRAPKRAKLSLLMSLPMNKASFPPKKSAIRTAPYQTIIGEIQETCATETAHYLKTFCHTA